MSVPPLLNAAGRRRSRATLPGYLAGRPPRNKGLRYPPDPPTVEEIVAVMRQAGGGAHGARLRALIVLLWRAGLRINEALTVTEHDLQPRAGSVLVRYGKGGRRREVGIPGAQLDGAITSGPRPPLLVWKAGGSGQAADMLAADDGQSCVADAVRYLPFDANRSPAAPSGDNPTRDRGRADDFGVPARRLISTIHKRLRPRGRRRAGCAAQGGRNGRAPGVR